MFQTDAKTINIIENLQTGFRLSNGGMVYGPMLVVNNEAFLLKISPPKQDASGKVVNPLLLLDPQALAILDVVTPKPELVVVGGGARLSPLSTDAKKYLTSIGLNVELASTRYASSTFNALSEEGRNVALLVLPAGVFA
ncbi:NADH dehydrogenase 1 alpha subcomplex assembly factor 3 [Coemansia spiralis]|nr:NADH dehydrogenase 1 alpha subcomplex assembly factor 3 [Coemansia spiralis]